MAMGFVPAPKQKNRVPQRIPQRVLPISAASTYSIFERVEYTWTNLKGRLIDHRKSMAVFKDVPLTATCVKQLDHVSFIDLLSQAIHVNLDCV